MQPKILMYATAVCPYCVRAEGLLRRKGVTDIEKVRINPGYTGIGRLKGLAELRGAIRALQ